MSDEQVPQRIWIDPVWVDATATGIISTTFQEGHIPYVPASAYDEAIAACESALSLLNNIGTGKSLRRRQVGQDASR